MSLIIVIVKIIRIVIRNVVTEIHDCYLLLVGGAGIEPASIMLIGCAPLSTNRYANRPCAVFPAVIGVAPEPLVHP